MKSDIAKSIETLLNTLEQCRTQEKDQKTIELYNLHVNRTKEFLDQLRKNNTDKSLIDNFFEQEGRNYGWSYLPNENGRLAEEAFWNLKKKLGYYK